MSLCWLHVSDFHFGAGDTYDSDKVLQALVRSVRSYRGKGRQCDLIFATGDIADKGRKPEYEQATHFFDALLDAAGLDRKSLFVVPGNHDVDRKQGIGLARTLGSREDSDAYFAPDVPKPHLSQKMHAFVEWHEAYFSGVRSMSGTSSCGFVELVERKGRRIAVMGLNTAFFSQDEHDHAKLMLGRRCVDQALQTLADLDAEFRIALMHHPLDWLSDVERSNVKAALLRSVDAVLRGHLHDTDVELVASLTGTTLQLAAGAAYQTRKWPNRALYVTLEAEGSLRVFPIRYEDSPTEVWTIDPSVFPHDPGFERRWPSPRALAGAPANPAPIVQASVPIRNTTNIIARSNLPFIGRDELLQDIARALSEPDAERVLVLHGPPGVGKSELSREYARRYRERYSGGRFIFTAGAEQVELARIGATALGLDFPPDLSLSDRCERTMLALHAAPVLLIFDNPANRPAIEAWLPRSGMPCHAIVTTVNEQFASEWAALEVPRLSKGDSLQLIEKLAGSTVLQRFGGRLTALADGLPVQLVPASQALAYEERRGRLDAASLDMSKDASASFELVLGTLDTRVRLLLYAAAFLEQQRIVREELFHHLELEYPGGRREFDKHLDVCLDLHLLDGGAELRVHQLLGAFLLRRSRNDVEMTDKLAKVRQRQWDRLIMIARELAETPVDELLSGAILGYQLDPAVWDRADVNTTNELWSVGEGLYSIGKFKEAKAWFERAVTEAEQGDVHGRVDHESLGGSLHLVGNCLSSLGQFNDAKAWFERAVKETEQGDVHGRVDHESLGSSLHLVGNCLSNLGQFDEAKAWFERAVNETEQGDVHGRIDHESLGSSLHQVGYCLSSLGQFDEARAWFERAVK
ncbi:MAG: tetratricopeptide repeat protein [Pseudomonadota bacterium]